MCEQRGEYEVDDGGDDGCPQAPALAVAPVEEALRRLRCALGEAGVLELVERLEAVSRETSYGDIHMVVALGRVTHIRATVSVKL